MSLALVYLFEKHSYDGKALCECTVQEIEITYE